ncbi:hypothetical protein BJ875DRAFT_422113 [Amylocarpus encephaloides]|uniref:Uncharacterized protein n=1 Tax=Amylocarpus encephaloides TaxID=45428 RepID=A0A9P8C6J3_9HELO|nr:hypothetical protein BJ875DRAFT_422113 [Amylocarpus encephaloides]
MITCFPCTCICSFGTDLHSFTMQDVEILVHTTAPSRGPDDAGYRALAQAYLQFVPARRQPLEIVGEVVSKTVDHQSEKNSQESQKQKQQETGSWESYRPSTADDHDDHVSEQLATNSTQETTQGCFAYLRSFGSGHLSFKSVDDNRASPFYQTRSTKRKKLAEESKKLFQSPTKSIPDSQPQAEEGRGNERGLFSSPTKVLELYLQQIDSSQDSPESYKSRRPEDPEVTPTRPERNNDYLNSSFEATHVSIGMLPEGATSSSSSDMARSRILETVPPKTIEKSLLREKDVPSASRSTFRLQVEESTTPVLARKVREMTRKAFSPVVPQVDHLLRIRPTPVMESYLAVDWLSPPHPPIGTDPIDPETFITPMFHKIAKNFPIDKLYHPATQSRVIEPLGRGYWRVDCSSWDQSLKEATWNTMGKLIAPGLLGWGVSCSRYSFENEGGKFSNGWDVFKCHCWGIQVPYVYCMIFMASQNKVAWVKSEWMVIRTNVVVTMPIEKKT